MDTSKYISNHSINEGIDFNKIRLIIRKNFFWMILLFIFPNVLSYLYIRYTKPVYKSTSELKLDIKTEATDLGLKSFSETSNLNVISGEIELIQSKLFLNRVLDALNLDVSYYNGGSFLNYEFFGNMPYNVKYKIDKPHYYNVPIYVQEENENDIQIKVGKEGHPTKGKYDQAIDLDGLELTLTKNRNFVASGTVDYFFVINSREVLLSYLLTNLSIQPLNFNANTISISFNDYSANKAQTIVNKIDSMYLIFSQEQKNLTNKQKIDWLTSELVQIESKMEKTILRISSLKIKPTSWTKPSIKPLLRLIKLIPSDSRSAKDLRMPIRSWTP